MRKIKPAIFVTNGKKTEILYDGKVLECVEKIKFSHKATKAGKARNCPEIKLTFDELPIVEGEFENFKRFLHDVLQEKSPSE